MLFTREVLAGIRDGRITLAFRRWRRPTVRPGGTLLTAVGQLAIQDVRQVSIDDITPDDVRAAGYASASALHAAVCERTEGLLYRIEFGGLGADPREALRSLLPADQSAIADVKARLARLDAAAPGGAWTNRALCVIRDRPGVRAGDLCVAVRLDKETFKRNVRKLKTLGLTESLEVGYQLSPRGLAILESSSD